jgi:hypothetical protein
VGLFRFVNEVVIRSAVIGSAVIHLRWSSGTVITEGVIIASRCHPSPMVIRSAVID